MRLCRVCQRNDSMLTHSDPVPEYAECACGHRQVVHIYHNGSCRGMTKCDCTKYHGCYTQLANGRLYARRI